MRVGYIRISTAGQHTERQDTALRDCERVFTDVCSGKDKNRPQLNAMLAFVRAGDTLVVESFSRLARSTVDLLKIVEILRHKGVELISIKESVDTSTATGKLQLTLFAALAEFEREQMLERQAEGIREAKRIDADLIAAGQKPVKYKGKPRIEVDKRRFATEYRRWKAGEQTAAQSMRNLGLKSNTFYRRVREYEQANEGRRQP